MSQADGRCPFCGNTLNPSSPICPSCGRNIFQTRVDDTSGSKIQPQPLNIVLTPRNLIIGGVIVLLIATLPFLAFLGLSRGGGKQSAQVPTSSTSTPSTSGTTIVIATATVVTQTSSASTELWIGTLTQGSTVYYVELHVSSFGQPASFQGTWCADMTGQTDLYGHSVCTDNEPISGTWVPFSSLGSGLQTDINNAYPNTTHDTIIIWSGHGDPSGARLCQDCRYYAFMQNNDLKGLAYYSQDSTSIATFSIILQNNGKSNLGGG